MAIYIFNPDTDMALATGRGSFTPPGSIVRFMAELALLPALYAPVGSKILLHPAVREFLIQKEKSKLEHLNYYEMMQSNEMQIVDTLEAVSEDEEIVPWGWNHAIAGWLRRHGTVDKRIPTTSQIERMRMLSHRCITVMAHKKLSERLRGKHFAKYSERQPIEVNDATELKEMAKDNPLFLKAPWSSSGKGVFVYEGEAALRERAEKIIAKQGSILVEPVWAKALDFATEWQCHDDKAVFLGVSLFECDKYGHYVGNAVAAQDKLRYRLTQHINGRALEEMIQTQRLFLEQEVASGYSGPVGIDCLAEKDGSINPFVELNLRHTMGYVAIKIAEYGRGGKVFVPHVKIT